MELSARTASDTRVPGATSDAAHSKHDAWHGRLALNHAADIREHLSVVTVSLDGPEPFAQHGRHRIYRAVVLVQLLRPVLSAAGYKMRGQITLGASWRWFQQKARGSLGPGKGASWAGVAAWRLPVLERSRGSVVGIEYDGVWDIERENHRSMGERTGGQKLLRLPARAREAVQHPAPACHLNFGERASERGLHHMRAGSECRLDRIHMKLQKT
eukprot:SAG11_NODE_73_length_18072_cov_8.670005_9_plen_214_part_00